MSDDDETLTRDHRHEASRPGHRIRIIPCFLVPGTFVIYEHFVMFARKQRKTLIFDSVIEQNGLACNMGWDTRDNPTAAHT